MQPLRPMRPTTGGTLRTWLALPLHGHLQPEHVRFIVKTLKHASPNVGAGAAID